MDAGFVFVGSPLQYMDACQFDTSADVTLAGIRFACKENSKNPRQLDFTTPHFASWKLAQVSLGSASMYAHVYPSKSGFLVNCFRGQPLGVMMNCGHHVLWWIAAGKVDAVGRTVKKKMMSSALKVSSTTLEVRSTHPDGAGLVVPVTIDALDDADDADFAERAVTMATEARGVPRPVWPSGLGLQRVTFT